MLSARVLAGVRDGPDSVCVPTLVLLLVPLALASLAIASAPVAQLRRSALNHHRRG